MRRKALMRLLHDGLTRRKAAGIAGLGRATVGRYAAAFREGGLGGLRAWGNVGPVGDLAAHAEAIEQLPLEHHDDLESPLTHNLHVFDNVSLLAA